MFKKGISFVMGLFLLGICTLANAEDQFNFPLGPIGGHVKPNNGTNQLRVTDLTENTPGKLAGLQVNDLIVGAYGQSFRTTVGGSHAGPTQDLSLAIEYAEENGEDLVLNILRSGVGSMEIRVQLKKKPVNSPAFPLNSPKYDEVWPLAVSQSINGAGKSSAYMSGYFTLVAVAHPDALDSNAQGGAVYAAAQRSKTQLINYAKSLKPFLLEPKLQSGLQSTLTQNDSRINTKADGSTWEMGQAGMSLATLYMRSKDPVERAELSEAMTALAISIAGHVQRWKQPKTGPNTTHSPYYEGIMSHGGLEGDYIHLGWGGGINICSSHTLAGMAALRASGGVDFQTPAPDAHNFYPNEHPLARVNDHKDTWIDPIVPTIDSKFLMGFNWGTNTEHGILNLSGGNNDGHVCYTTQGASDFDAAGRTAGFAMIGHVCSAKDPLFKTLNFGKTLSTAPTNNLVFKDRIDRMTAYVSRRWATQMNCHCYCFPGTFYSEMVLPFMTTKQQQYWLDNWKFYYNMCRKQKADGTEEIEWFSGRSCDEAYVDRTSATRMNVAMLKLIAQGNVPFLPGFKKERILMKYRYPFVTWPTIEARALSITKPQESFRIDVSDGVGNALDANDLTAKWSLAEGPGDVRFTHPDSVNTAVVFPKNGVYRLRLMLEKTGYEAWEELIDVTVNYEPLPNDLIKGSLNGELFTNISSNNLSALKSAAKFPLKPDVTFNTTTIYANNKGDNYGGRIYGYLIPPQTDTYTFYMAVDDQGEFKLNTEGMDENNLTLIQTVSSATGASSFRTAAKTAFLVENTPYYFEVLWKEGTGGDYINVQWSNTTDTERRAISSQNVAYKNLADPALRITQQPRDVVTSIGASVTLDIAVDGEGPFLYQWRKNGVNATVQSLTSTFTIPSMSAALVGNYDCVVTSPRGTLTSTIAKITMNNESSILQGGLWREDYTYVSGGSINELRANSKFPLYPDATDSISKLGQSPMNVTNGGMRLSGWIQFPNEGRWRLGSRQDDQAELYLSFNEEPDYKARILNSTAYWAAGWSSYITVTDTKQLYYIEYLFKFNATGDHFGIYWQKEGDPVPTITLGGSNIPDTALFFVNGGCGTIPNPDLKPVAYDQTMTVYNMNQAEFNVVEKLLAYTLEGIEVVSVGKALYGTTAISADKQSVIYIPGEHEPAEGDKFTYVVRNANDKTTQGTMNVVFSELQIANYYYPMNEARGDTLFCMQLEAPLGHIISTDVQGARVPGKYDVGVQISRTTATHINLPAALMETRCFWFKTSQTAPNDNIDSMPALLGFTSPQSTIKIGAVDSQGHLGIITSKTQKLFSKKSISDGEWHHIALFWAGAYTAPFTMAIYIDGELDAAGELTCDYWEFTNNFSTNFGASRVLDQSKKLIEYQYVDGIIDDLRTTYSRFSDADIKNFYKIKSTGIPLPAFELTADYASGDKVYAPDTTLNFNCKILSYGRTLDSAVLKLNGAVIANLDISNIVFSSTETLRYPCTTMGDCRFEMEASIDHKIYKSNRISLNIIPEASIASSVWSHYTLDETEPGVIHDVANGHHGEYVSSSGIVANTQGILNRCFNFQSEHQGLSVPGFAKTVKNNITLSAWIKPNGVQNDRAGILVNPTKGNGLFITDNGDLRYIWGGGSWNESSELYVSDNTWTFVALTVTPTNTTFYMRPYEGGKLGELQSYTYYPRSGNSDQELNGTWHIGNNKTLDINTRYFVGQIDEVRMYDHALPASAIEAISNIDSKFAIINLKGPLTQTIETESGTYPITAQITEALPEELRVPIVFAGTSKRNSPTGYTASSSEFVFAPGQKEATIELTIIDDNVSEKEEYIELYFGEIPFPHIAGDSNYYRLNILNNDNTYVSISPAKIHLDAKTRSYEFSVNIPTPIDADLEIPYLFSGSAAYGVDYTCTSPEILRLPAGQTSTSLTIEICQDQIFKPTLDLTVKLGPPYFNHAGINHEADSAQLTFDCNVGQPVLTWKKPTVFAFNESDGSIDCEIELSRPSSRKITMDANFTGTAKIGEDFGLSSTQFIFEPGETTKNFKLNIIDDISYEGTEDATITLTSSDSVLIPEAYTFQILDDENAPEIIPEKLPTAVQRGSISELVLKVNLTAKSSHPTVLPITFGGTAILGVDYSYAGLPEVVIDPETTSATFRIGIISTSASLFQTKTLTLQFGTPQNALLSPGNTTQSVTLVGDQSLELFYKFDKETDTVLIDHSGKNRHGIFNALPTGVTRTAGKTDSGLEFAGSDAFNFDFSDTPITTKDMTICAWINIANTNDKSILHFIDSQNVNYAGLRIAASRVQGRWIPDQPDFGGFGNVVPTNQWVLVAMVANSAGNSRTAWYSSTTSNSYNYKSTTVPHTFSRLVFGANPSGTGSYFQGKIDEVRVYSKAMTSQELAAIFMGNIPMQKIVAGVRQVEISDEATTLPVYLSEPPEKDMTLRARSTSPNFEVTPSEISIATGAEETVQFTVRRIATSGLIDSTQILFEADNYYTDSTVVTYRKETFPSVSFEQPILAVEETAGTLTFKARLSKPATTALEVPLFVAGDANRGIHYTFNHASVRFEAGSTEAALTLNIIPNLMLYTGDKVFETAFDLGSCDANPGEYTSCRITIQDLTPIPQVQFPQSSVAVDPATMIYSVPLIITNPTEKTIRVAYEITRDGIVDTFNYPKIEIPAKTQTSEISVPLMAKNNTTIVRLVSATNSEVDSTTQYAIRTLGTPLPTLNVSQGTTTEGIQLNWDGTSGLPFDVYRSETRDGMFEKISIYNTSGEFLDIETIPGKTYFYVIKFAESTVK